MWWTVVGRVPWVGKIVFLVSSKLRDLHAAATVVADELDYNAEIVGRYHASDSAISTTRAELRLDAWNRYRGTLAVYARQRPDLWADLSAVMTELQRTEARGASPPAADKLTNLAERLREAGY